MAVTVVRSVPIISAEIFVCEVKIVGELELSCVLQVSGLRFTKLFDLFMLQATRRAKLMCDESYICQMLDYLHLLKGFQWLCRN
jgi:hypothetical protein